MRKGLKISLAALLVVGVIGCSKKEDKQKSMIKSINSFTQYGFDVNKTNADSSKFVLTVKDNKRLTQNILALFNQQTLNPKDREPIEKLVKNAKLGVEVDWDKYSNGKEDSVFVYYMGNAKESKEFKKFLEGKNLGAYLTFNNKSELKLVKIKDIDSSFGEGKKRVNIVYKDALIKIDKFANTYKDARKYDIDFGKLKIKDASSELTFTNNKCSIDKENSYVGTTNCKFGNFIFINKLLDAKFDIKNIAYKGIIKQSGKKLTSDAVVSIDSMAFTGKENPTQSKKVTFNLDKLLIDVKSSNIDKKMVDSMYAIMDKNVTSDVLTKEMFSLLSKYVASGIKGEGKVSYDKFEITSSKGDIVSLIGYKANFDMLLDKVINFSWNSSTKSMKILSYKRAKRVELVSNNDKFGYKIEDMYNFIPAFIDAIPKDASTKIDDKKMMKIGEKIVNSGLKFKLGTIGFDSVKVDAKPMKIDFGKLTIDLESKLKENSVDLSKRTSQMMLIQYLEANGKVVLKRKDLDTILKLVPPTTAMMISAFVKNSGEDALFELKFENGHLTINGKKVM